MYFLLLVAPRRSHAILTVYLTTRTACRASEDVEDVETTKGTQVGGPGVGRGGRGEAVTTSKLHLVDLAGSEKSSVVSSAMPADAAMLHREGRFINKSLAFLEQVLVRFGSDQGKRGRGISPRIRFTLSSTNLLAALLTQRAHAFAQISRTDDAFFFCR